MKYYCTVGFKIWLAFQWYIICNFSSCRLKDMIFQRLGTNLIQISNLNRVWTREGHVASSYWPVPIRLDHGRGPLDLKRRGRSRSAGTGSLKWTDLVLQVQIGRTRLNRGGRGYLGFTADWWRWGLLPGSWRQRCSGDFWAMARPRRGAGHHGELRCLVIVEVRVQRSKVGASRDRRGGSVLGRALACWFTARQTRKKGQGGASCHGKGGRREGRSSPTATNSSGNARRSTGFRRWIPSSSMRLA
jgi:hypothetical protein